MEYKAFIFDRDGTLFDSLDVILDAFQYGAEPFVKKLPTREEWFAAFGPAEKEVLGKFVGSALKQAAFLRFFDYYRRHFDRVRLYEGIPELLSELKGNGARLMLFTGGGNASTWYCLEQSGLLPLFDALVCGEDVRSPKPDPEGIIKLMTEQQVKPQETIVIGDAASDVEAGKAAQAFTAWLCWSENAKFSELKVAPDFVCTSVPDLRRVLLDRRES